MDFLRAFLKVKSLIKSLKVSDQWRAKVWWGAGRLLLIVGPLPNSSIEQQRMVVIVDIRCWIYAVCNVTIWCHICVCKPTFWRSSLTQSAYYSTRTLLSRCCTMCYWNERKLSALQVKRPEKNTTINATKEQFIQ